MLHAMGQSIKAASIAAAAADVDTHLAGPPTGGALSVGELDILDTVSTTFSASDITILDKFATDNTVIAGVRTPTVVLRFGATATEGYEIATLDETVDMLDATAASWPLTSTIPAGAVILAVQANLQDAITAVTAVKVGIGVTADPDKYGKTATLDANAKVDTIPTHVVLASTETIAIFAVDTNGAAAGTIGGGATGTDEVRVRIVYATLNSLDDAV